MNSEMSGVSNSCINSSCPRNARAVHEIQNLKHAKRQRWNLLHHCLSRLSFFAHFAAARMRFFFHLRGFCRPLPLTAPGPGCTFRGPWPAPAPRGYEFRGFLRVRGRRSLGPWPVEIKTRPRPARKSIMICRCLVLIPSFLIVTFLAERLPIRSVPEELRIATVRNDVVDHGRPRILWRVLTHTPHTQRTCLEELLAFLLPAAVVSSPAGRPALVLVHGLVFLAVLLARFHQLAAAWVAARYLWLSWHRLAPSHVKSPRRLCCREGSVVIHFRQLNTIIVNE